jgi:hypothetical protein
MGSGRVGRENLVARVFSPGATPSSESEGGPGPSRAASSFRQALFSALLRSSRGALRHHGRPCGPMSHQGELTCCMTS